MTNEQTQQAEPVYLNDGVHVVVAYNHWLKLYTCHVNEIYLDEETFRKLLHFARRIWPEVAE